MKKKNILVLSIITISAIVIALFAYWQWHSVHNQGDKILTSQLEQTSDSTIPNLQNESNTISRNRKFYSI